jgi:tetratricopeptide (TPR) repeat protein
MHSVLYSNCLSIQDIEIEITPKNEFIDLIVLKVKQLPYKTIEKVNLGLPPEKNQILQFKDLNFDGIKEIILDVSSHDVKKEYAIYSLQCKNIIEFNPAIINNFKINEKEKELIEYTRNKDGFKPITNTYCLNNSNYYLCKKDEYIEKKLSRISRFDKSQNLIQVNYFFSDKFFNQDATISTKNITDYNNIAYYLEQASAYKEAIYLLEKIIEKFPHRTVAYINLGDAYWGDNNKEKAKKAYQTYIQQMKEQGKERRIPKKILERVTE